MREERLGDFHALVGAQFLGAFNDNLFKQLLLFLAASTLFPGEDRQGLAFAIFAAPFVLFSGMAGDLSERFSKRQIIVMMKVLEIAVMGLGAAAFLSGSWTFLLGVLFLMGTQSAFFGPSKYGVIPELLPPDRLLHGNGLIQMTTFMAILLGTALAGPLLDSFGAALWAPGLICCALAVIGTIIARRMRPLPPQRPTLAIGANPFGRLRATIGRLRAQKGLFQVVLCYSLFWFDGGVLQQAIAGLGEPGYLDTGQGEKWKLSALLVVLSLAIMIGCLIAPRLRVRPGRMAFMGALGMVAGQLGLLVIGPLVRGDPAVWVAGGLLGVVGLGGALFVVPLQSYLQDAPPPGMRGQTFAVNNFMNFLFIFFGGLYYMATRQWIEVGPAISQAGAAAALLVFLWLNRAHVADLAIGSDPKAPQGQA